MTIVWTLIFSCWLPLLLDRGATAARLQQAGSRHPAPEKITAGTPLQNADPEIDLRRFEFSQPQMGTTFRILLYARTQKQANQAAQAAFHRAAELEQLFSDYREDSELARLCRSAGSGPVRVAPELADVLRKSLLWSQRSQGAFDVTVGPLVSLWRRSRRTRELPTAEALHSALALVGYRHVLVDPHQDLVTLKLARMKIDLGGIGKGYCADAMQMVLRGHGISRALVAAGGDICVSQRPPGSAGWVVTVAPLEKVNRDFPARLLLENQAVSTSGDLEQYVEIQGVRYSHIVDPKTGLGLIGRMSATVVASCGTDADAAAKPVCILGPEKGPAWIDQFAGMACLFLHYDDQGQVQQRHSAAWPKLRFKTVPDAGPKR